jgi:hypothetical protein
MSEKIKKWKFWSVFEKEFTNSLESACYWESIYECKNKKMEVL